MLTVRRATFVYLISGWWGGRRGDCGRDEWQLAALTSVLPRWSSSHPSLHGSGCALVFRLFARLGQHNRAQLHRFVPCSRRHGSITICPLLACPGLFLSVSPGDSPLTAHIHFSQYTTFGSSRLCCGISSIPCPRPGYDWYARRAFQRAYSWVCNLSRPFASSQLNQVRRADTRFLPDVGRRHVRPTNSHIFRAKNLIPRRSHLNENRNS